MGDKRFVYADNAATTPLAPEVLERMTPYFTETWFNPSSPYGRAGAARRAVQEARAAVAGTLGCAEGEVFFTSGGSEADNWALKGALMATDRRHVVTTRIEHPAVLESCRTLERLGYRVTYVDVDCNGVVRLDQLENAVTDGTAVVAVMTANNEIGTLQPVAEAARIAHARGALMFTDAVQAFGTLPLDVTALGVDLLSLSGHKINGPKGVGALYVREGTPLARFVDGGGQESGRRAGTENVPAIVGLGAAAALSCARVADADRIRAMRDRLITGLSAIPGARLNGHPTERLPGNAHFTFRGVSGEGLALLLDLAGICVGTGAACSSGNRKPSHVLTACGVSAEDARSAIRLTLGHQNTEEDVTYILQQVPLAVSRLRGLGGEELTGG